jgi:hypothetical protein
VSRYKVEELCFDLGNSANTTRFKADPDAFIASYPLTEAEKEVIKKGDVGALYKMGVLTQAIICLSRAFGYDNATYVSKLRDAAGLPEIKEQIEILTKRSR